MEKILEKHLNETVTLGDEGEFVLFLVEDNYFGLKFGRDEKPVKKYIPYSAILEITEWSPDIVNIICVNSMDLHSYHDLGVLLRSVFK